MTKPTMLDKVRQRLADMKGRELFTLSDQTGISYDTLLRIRDGRNDPGFGKVQTLAMHFKVIR